MSTWHEQTTSRATGELREETDGLGRSALVLGIASFLPIPGVIAAVLAIAVGAASGWRDESGRRRRSREGTTGIALGVASLCVFLAVCFVYFGILGYPLPQISHYHPPMYSGQHGGCVC